MDRAKFFNSVRPMFEGGLTAKQVTGISSILDAFEEVGDDDVDTLAYSLATVHHETDRRFEAVREGFAKTDAGARRAVASLAKKRGPKSAPAKYGLSTAPYGHAYYGRGFPQLTWKENYAKSSEDAGVDLIKDPDAMLDPKISARVLIRGIMDGRWNGKGKGIDFYEGEDEFLDDDEAAEARRTVNVQDKAVRIAGYHRKYYDALLAAGFAKAPTSKPQTSAVPEILRKVEEVKAVAEAVNNKVTKVSTFNRIITLILFIISKMKGKKK